MKSELVHNSGTKQGAQNPDLLKLVSFFGAFDLGLCAKKKLPFYNVGVRSIRFGGRLGARITCGHRCVTGEGDRTLAALLVFML